MNTQMRSLHAIAFVAIAILLLLSSPASAGKSTKCVEQGNNTVDITGSDGGRCVAISDGTGVAHSTASGSGSYAEATVSHEGGNQGKANAVAKVGGTAVAGGDGGHATATSTGANSVSSAQSFSGTAKSVSSSGGDASTLTQANCKANSNATGSGSFAYAECAVAGAKTTAVATGGGQAEGTDSGATCTANGGTAVVTGNAHTCHAP
ncbi:MAG TPA: hypothetical protein VEU51_17070 [Candidatus Acidoferrales bacterium]|nr:hypothetical protein [Candidatus Acidoferrales bacterium]